MLQEPATIHQWTIHHIRNNALSTSGAWREVKAHSPWDDGKGAERKRRPRAKWRRCRPCSRWANISRDTRTGPPVLAARSRDSWAAGDRGQAKAAHTRSSAMGWIQPPSLARSSLHSAGTASRKKLVSVTSEPEAMVGPGASTTRLYMRDMACGARSGTGRRTSNAQSTWAIMWHQSNAWRTAPVLGTKCPPEQTAGHQHPCPPRGTV